MVLIILVEMEVRHANMPPRTRAISFHTGTHIPLVFITVMGYVLWMLQTLATTHLLDEQPLSL
jgi:hypothetical protein